jgi:VRR-NUC domain-containing protein
MEWVRLQSTIKRLILHFPNEGKRSPRYGKLMKDLGMRAGVSDLFIPMARHGFIGAWIEIKTSKGIVSVAQKDFLSDMEQLGHFTTICRSIEEGINTIKWYCYN